ncbi:hypothetical protein HAX54_044357 [Datura stramonium]|uniref:Uncharacterized protein n=1 Tax=Datura stramonium TaxID=4076 RepID=A0ABS8W3X0_DATST|nr:hypothetical protein [Datura stramonium]
MGAGLKKDLRVFRVGPGGSLKTFFFFSSELFHKDLLGVPLSEISREEDQVGPCKQLDALSPFNPLSEMHLSSPPHRNYEITPWTLSTSRGPGLTIEPFSISEMH